jgi:HEPN domain-containing protein
LLIAIGKAVISLYLLSEKELSLNHGSQIIGDIRVQALTGQAGIGIYQLRFSLLFAFPAWTNPGPFAQLRNLRAKVLAGSEHGPRKLLGLALPEAVLSFVQRPHSQDERFLLDLAITPEQLNALEELRGGGGVQFELILQSETEGQHGILRADDTVFWSANLSVWTSVLAELGLKETVLVAVQIPKHEANGAGRTAIETLRRAKEYLIAGEYEMVVSKCRLALESIKAELGEAGKINSSLESFIKNRRAMSKRERLMVITEALRHYTHPAHHVDKEGKMEWYSRADATFALSVTAAAISVEIQAEDVPLQMM